MTSTRGLWVRDLLSTLSVEEMALLAHKAGVDMRFVRQQESPHVVAFNIVNAAEGQGGRHMLHTLISVMSQHPTFWGNPWLRQMHVGYVPTRGQDVVPRMVDEVLTAGRDTLVPATWLHIGFTVGQAVVRIRMPGGLLGSGFFLDMDFLVTNNHVLPTPEDAAVAHIDTHYERDDQPLRTVRLDPDKAFITSKEDDLTIVALGNYSVDNIPARYGKAQPGHYCQIWQHPGGGVKKLGVYHNVITYAGDDAVQYLTDTMPGSSGSPVFDEEWNLIAVHRSGGWQKYPMPNSSVVDGYINEGTPAARLGDLYRKMGGRVGKSQPDEVSPQ